MAKNFRIWLTVGLALIAAGALSQLQAQNIRVGAMCDNRLSVSWKSSPGVKGYRLTPQVEGSGKVSCSDSKKICVIKGLKPGQTYDYYLDSEDHDGRLIFGDPIQFRGPRTEACPEYVAETPTPYVPVDTCSTLPGEIIVRGHLPFSTQCQQVSGAAVGDAELIAGGILNAVDVWASVRAEIQVCFHQQGRLYFLDAATSPRARSDLPAERIEGMTCGTIDRAGTVVLLEGSAGAIESLSQGTADTEPTIAAEDLRCLLVSTAYVSLRRGPSVYYARILSMPQGTRLIAAARAGDWFMVDYEGQSGWSSGAHLTQSAGCDAIGESSRVFLPLGDELAPAEGEAQEESLESAQAETTGPGPNELSDCRLTAGDIINLRTEPGIEQAILVEIPFRSQLIATERAGDWFKVEYEGRLGWVNLDYVFRNGACG